MDAPTHHTPDYFERAARETDLTHGLAVPEFEAGIILATIRNNPGLLKGELVKKVMGRLGRPGSEERVFLKYVDNLITIRQVVRHSFTYHLTPGGQSRLKQIRESLQSAMNLLYTSAP